MKRETTAVDDLERIGLLSVFQRVVALKDRYGLHAYLTALENANLRVKLDEEIHASQELSRDKRESLLEVLQSGRLPVEPLSDESAPLKAEALP